MHDMTVSFNRHEFRDTDRAVIRDPPDIVSSEVNEFGSQREMAHIERIMREGTGADRQLAAFARTQDMKAVVDQIVEETYEGLDLSMT